MERLAPNADSDGRPMNHSEHDARILDQFTRQAVPFAELAAHSSAASIALILETAGIGAGDEVLDVACGPGLLTCAIARVARRVVGVDFVPAMLERARAEQERAGLENMEWRQGDARAIPCADASFDHVVTRFSFHHLPEPLPVLREMLRVCRPGGTVTVVDATPTPETRAAYDHLETLRDPSHTRAVTQRELEALYAQAGLGEVRCARFRLDMELEKQLAASFPNEGDADRIRALLRADLDEGRDRHDLAPHEHEGTVYFSYPCSIVAGQRRA